jgi:hypothetical protein
VFDPHQQNGVRIARMIRCLQGNHGLMADYILFVTAAAALTASILLGVIVVMILASRTGSQNANTLHAGLGKSMHRRPRG